MFIKGLDEVSKGVTRSKAMLVLWDVDEEIGKMTKELSQKASSRAPVLTGQLRNSLADKAERVDFLSWQMPVDLDNVPYTWRQNFEHATKRYYITASFNEIESQFAARLQKVVDSGW